MNKYRIEFLGTPAADYRLQRQSSIFVDDGNDVTLIYNCVKHITTWKEWVSSGEIIRAVMLDMGSGRDVYRSGIPGVVGEIFHRATA
jgi:hypothetical protein